MPLPNTNLQNISSDIKLKDSKSKIKDNFDKLLQNDIYLINNSGSGGSANVPHINVKHPPTPLTGAIGDGITDDTLAIQRCINYAFQNCKHVILPEGTYLISKTLLLPTYTTIEGVGRAIIKKSGIETWTSEEESGLYDPDSYTDNDALITLVRTKDDEFPYTQLQKVINLRLEGSITSYIDPTLGNRLTDWQKAIFSRIDAPKVFISGITTANVDSAIHLHASWMSTIQYCPWLFGWYYGIRITTECQGTYISNINTGGTRQAAVYLRGSGYSMVNTVLAEWTYGGVSFDLGFGHFTLVACGTEICTNTKHYFKISNANVILMDCSSITVNETHGTDNSVTVVNPYGFVSLESIFWIGNGSRLTVIGYDAKADLADTKTNHAGKLVTFYGDTNTLNLQGTFTLNKPFVNQVQASSENMITYNGTHIEADTNGVTHMFMGDKRHNSGVEDTSLERVMNLPKTPIITLGSDNSPTRFNDKSLDWHQAFNSGDFFINKNPSLQGVGGFVCMNARNKVYTLKGSISSRSGSYLFLTTMDLLEVTDPTGTDQSGFKYGSTTATGETLWNFRKECYLKAYDASNNLIATATTIGVDMDTKAVQLYMGDGNYALFDTAGITKLTISMGNNVRNNLFSAIPLVLADKTGGRPKYPIKGYCYFDTTLNKPIWYNGTNWVDSTGATV